MGILRHSSKLPNQRQKNTAEPTRTFDSNEILQLMNSVLHVESEIGVGSSFLFKISLIINNSQASIHKKYLEADKVRDLGSPEILVEDNGQVEIL